MQRTVCGRAGRLPDPSYIKEALLPLVRRWRRPRGLPSYIKSIAALKTSGAGDEARTRYLHLGKVALYQMSYARI